MPASRSNHASDAAARLLEEHGNEAISVDVEMIARSLGALIVFEAFDGSLSGSLVKEAGNTPVIAINTSHHPNRQRFSIAHELGHLQLHATRKREDHVFLDRPFRALRSDVSSLGTDRREVEANAFAASLLMPEEKVFEEATHQLHGGQDDPAALAAALASSFGVSEQAMTYRLINLGLLEPW